MNRQLAKPNFPNQATPGYEEQLLSELRKHASDVIEQINSQVQGVGKPLVSSRTIVPQQAIHHVTGSTPISYVTLPEGFTGDVTLIADDGFSTLTGGNIATAVSAPAGKALRLTYDGSMLYPLVSA